jgi:hypothetical protein
MWSTASLETKPTPGKPTMRMGFLSFGFFFIRMKDSVKDGKAM